MVQNKYVLSLLIRLWLVSEQGQPFICPSLNHYSLIDSGRHQQLTARLLVVVQCSVPNLGICYIHLSFSSMSKGMQMWKSDPKFVEFMYTLRAVDVSTHF